MKKRKKLHPNQAPHKVVSGSVAVTLVHSPAVEELKEVGRWNDSQSTCGGAHRSRTSCQVFPWSVEYCRSTCVLGAWPLQPILRSNWTTVAPLADTSHVSANLWAGKREMCYS